MRLLLLAIERQKNDSQERLVVQGKMILSGKINDGRRSDYAKYYVDISM